MESITIYSALDRARATNLAICLCLLVHDADCLYQLDNLLVEMPYQVVYSTMLA